MAESESASLENQEWLCSVKPSRTVYFPQLGDHLVYLKQAHQEYLEKVKKRKLYEVDQSDEPLGSIRFEDLRVHEHVKVVEIRYVMQQLRLCCLKLELSDETSFTVKYRNLDGVSDFLVLRQTFDVACKRKWRSGQKIRRLIGKVWFNGRVVAVQDYNHLRYPRSQYKRLRVEWDNERLEEVSPWEVEPVDQKAAVCIECNQKHRSEAPEKIGESMYSPELNEWPHDGRTSACCRFLNELDELMKLPIAKPFLKLNGDLSYFSIANYPVDLQTIHDRLENRFYRRVAAIRFDVEMLAKNITGLKERPVVIDSFSSENNIFDNCEKVTETLFKMIGDPSENGASQSKTSSSKGAVGRESAKRAADSNESEDNFSSADTIVGKSRKRRRACTNNREERFIRRSTTFAGRGKNKPYQNCEEILIKLPCRSSAKGKETRNHKAKNSGRRLILRIVDDYEDKSEEDEDGEDDNSDGDESVEDSAPEEDENDEENEPINNIKKKHSKDPIRAKMPVRRVINIDLPGPSRLANRSLRHDVDEEISVVYDKFSSRK